MDRRSIAHGEACGGAKAAASNRKYNAFVVYPFLPPFVWNKKQIQLAQTGVRELVSPCW